MTAAAATMPQPNMLAAALAYASKGLPVIPLHNPASSGCSCKDGVKCRSVGKHPRSTHGKDDGTTDEATIRGWWRKWPQANIGLWCRDFVVLDVDPRNGGNESLEELLANESDSFDFGTLEALTGSGGTHYVFKAPDFPVTAPGIAPGLDLKAAGGYIVVEPSMHPSGQRYAWIDPDVPPVAMPGWLLTLIRDKQGADKVPSFVPRRNDASAFDMETFIESHVKPMGWQISGPSPSPEKIGGMAWDIEDGCPFDRALLGGNPRFGVNASGAAFYVCHCCNDKHRWIDFKKLVGAVEPSRRTAESFDVEVKCAWPKPLGPAALIGLAGDVVRMIEPTTESDPAAILFQFLTMFGNIVERGPHWIVEDTQHFTNLFVAVVGDTAKARKGTGYDRVRAVFKGVETEWDNRVQSGLSSGEGLIWAVRDPIIETVAVKEKGKPTTYSEEQTDSGEKDKRLLVVEPEFARVLSAGQRQGNTLTAVIREAWDSKPLGLMTKSKRASCKDPHVSIISHITKEELLRCLTDTETANGYANRFLFVCSRRSKILPFGGERIDWEEIRIRLRSAINNARRTGEIPMDSEARELWAVVYERLSSGGGGLFGSVTARAEAQARRLACVYALLDESPYVRVAHLRAGLEAWRYCEDSCRSIFGDATGDPAADSIMGILRRTLEGLTRTDLFNHFQKHKKSEEIGRALQALQKLGRVRSVQEETGGRPVERWFAI